MSGVFSSSKEEQWRDLQKWMNELRQVAQEEERRLETGELRRMGEEDRHSRSRQAWDQIRERRTSKPVLQVVLSRSDHKAFASTLLWCKREDQADLDRHPVALMYQPILNTGAQRGTLNVSVIYAAFNMQYSFERT